MICPKCNFNNAEGSSFCSNCGSALEKRNEVIPDEKVRESGVKIKNNGKGNNRWIIPVAIGAAAFVLVAAVIITAVAFIGYKRFSVKQPSAANEERDNDRYDSEKPDENKDRSERNKDEDPKAGREDVDIKAISRASMVDKDAVQYYDETLVPSVPDYKVKPDLGDIFNPQDIDYLPEDAKNKLSKNQFVVLPGGLEFFDIYETNRYAQVPSFITVDSMMHTYHLYFAHLLKTIEKEELYDELRELTGKMYEKSVRQFDDLEGTEWEKAALRNVAFFTVGGRLLGDKYDVLPKIKGVVADELELIKRGEVATSPLFNDYEDYSQYKPRGYYADDPVLEKYFRAMMWYGRRAFEQRDKDLMRSALLMTLAMRDDELESWEGIYTVTAFFAGASDDATYYEFEPIVKEAYGSIDDVRSLAGDDSSFEKYYELTKEMSPPQINSIPVLETDDEKTISSFRFMGQRFSIDATIFQNLIYSRVDENSNGEPRMLPDALDIPAVLGSQTAYDILKEQGDTDYGSYDENMENMKEEIEKQEDGDLWTASLYAQWLNTLRPVLIEKGRGYPSFMQNEEWNRKSVEGFLGSYAELKHDTILYSKQAMAEMGGGWEEEIDDRGYVEPEPVIYSRFAVLAESTANGLENYGMLDGDDRENLEHMAELAKKLVVISEKELRNEKLSGEEYDLIRDFGGDLEHLWADATKEDDDEYPRTDEHPGAIIADVATDPNGAVLEIGTGRADDIYVICPVDGTLRVCRGSVYSFYEFPWPISDRLTDKEWRIKLGIWPESGYDYNEDKSIKQPEWTQGYRAHYDWD